MPVAFHPFPKSPAAPRSNSLPVDDGEDLAIVWLISVETVSNIDRSSLPAAVTL